MNTMTAGGGYPSSQTSYSVGGCTQFGTYLGNGTQFGTSGEYSVYSQTISGGHRITFAKDYGCIVVAQHDVITQASNPLISTAKNTNTTGGGNVSSALYAKGLSGPMMYAVLGVGLLGIVGSVWLMERKPKTRA